MCKDETPDDANVLGGRIVLEIKKTETKKSIYNTRIFVQGHTDPNKEILTHTENKVTQHYIRIIIPLTVIWEFRIWTQEVSQVYLQAGEKWWNKCI